MIIISQSNAQYLVINDSISGGVNIPFQDTLLSSVDPMSGSCTALNYYVDLDQDSINDIEFHLECSMGGFGSFYKMIISTLNDFLVHRDTSFVEHFQYIGTNGQAQDTTRKTPIVRKYVWGDTIYNNQNLLSTEEYLLHYSFGNYPPCIYHNIDAFLEDTSYIAFSKSNLDIFSIYYVKIKVPYMTLLELISAKTDDLSSDIIVKELFSNYIFPNPATEVIHFKEGFDSIEIYTLQGTLLVKENLSNTRNLLNVAGLQSGFYIVNLQKDEFRFLTKFLKL